ncbi:MAG: Rieske (2Fe-2S) protein [Synechococcaceae cyanobacterium SM2_3_2]|nr:Rieske (2Fe-2S) protein [Synechococcaceae cyanobacterium SM2_3_2]
MSNQTLPVIPQTATNRRTVLQLLAFLTGSASGLLPALLRSGTSVAFAENHESFVEIAELEDFVEGVYVTETPDGDPLMLLLIEAEGEDPAVYGLSGVCTHAGCKGQDNWVIEDEVVVCRCHGSQFSFDGEVVKGPASRPLATFEVKIEDEMVLFSKAEA